MDGRDEGRRTPRRTVTVTWSTIFIAGISHLLSQTPCPPSTPFDWLCRPADLAGLDDMRRLASQVPDQVSRLLRSTRLRAPPSWYAAVLSNPPPRLPPLKSTRPAPNTALDGQLAAAYKCRGGSVHRVRRSGLEGPRWKLRAITFAEDGIRKRFFQDFPFEALRPVSMVEMTSLETEHEMHREEWTSLEQRGAYPTVEEWVHVVTQCRELRS